MKQCLLFALAGLFVSLSLLIPGMFVHAQWYIPDETTNNQNTTDKPDTAENNYGLDQGIAEINNQMAKNAYSLQVSPELPTAFETVSINAVSYSFNIDASVITWTLNGKIILSGVGQKKFSFQMGSIGSVTTLAVKVETKDYGTITQQRDFVAVALDTLWQADTYTPPFYKGKALPSSQAMVKVVAYPSFVIGKNVMDPETLVYTWKKGYYVDQDGSGIGKNVYIYTCGYPKNTDSISASAISLDKSAGQTKVTDITVREPKIAFYEHHPLEGVRYKNQLRNTVAISKSQFTVHAVPYFFSFSSRNKNNGVFSWVLDGKTLHADPDNKSEFILQIPEKGSGGVNLSLEIGNKDRYIQEAKSDISVTFSH